MNTDHSIGIIRQKSQSVPDAVEACFATFRYQFRGAEPIFIAEPFPVFMLFGRRNEYNPNAFECYAESLDGVHQYWFPSDRQKLLGHLSAHAKPLAPSHDNRV